MSSRHIGEGNSRGLVVIADKAGRLGNRLLVFAHLIAAEAEHGFTVANPSFDEYAANFPSLRNDPLNRYPAHRSKLPANPLIRRAAYLLTRAAAAVLIRVGRRPSRFGIVRLPPTDRHPLDLAFADKVRSKKAVLLQGWLFRSEEALRRHDETVRRFLTPVDGIATAARSITGRARGDADVLVGVHIRQGDYRVHHGGRFFFGLQEYSRVMARVESLMDGRRVAFLLCSDEPFDPGPFRGMTASRGSGDSIEDMFALSLCDLLVGPPSSYTMWASFYGRVPLFHLVREGASPMLDDFCIYPEVSDPEVGALY